MVRKASIGFIPGTMLALKPRFRRDARKCRQWTTRLTRADEGKRLRAEDPQGKEASKVGGLMSKGEAASTPEEAGNLDDGFFTRVKTSLEDNKKSEDAQSIQGDVAGKNEIMNRIFEAFKSLSLVGRLPAQLQFLSAQVREKPVATEQDAEGAEKRPVDASNGRAGTTTPADISNVLGLSTKLDEPELQQMINEEILELLGVTDDSRAKGAPCKAQRKPANFDLYTAVNLAGFSFKMYKMPKGGMVLYGTDGREYHMTSTLAARKVFCGVVILTVAKFEHNHNSFIPVVLRAVGHDHHIESVEINQVQAIYVQEESRDILLELRVRSANWPAIASATFTSRDLSDDNEMKTLTLTLKKLDGDGKVLQDGEVYGTVTVEACYFDIRDVDDDALDAFADVEDDDDPEADSDSPDEVVRHASGAASIKSLKELQSRAENESSAEYSELEELETREWEKFALQVRDCPIGLHRMERIAYVLSPETDTRFCLWRAGKNVVFAFRGTETTSWKDLLTDSMLFLFPFEPGTDSIDTDVWKQRDWMLKNVKEQSDTTAVHYGFLRAYAAVRESALEAVRLFAEDGAADYHLYITGHSLGGALATIFASDVATLFPDLKLTMYNFGSPKVGNAAFVEMFDALVPDAVRVVNNTDVVARMPRREWNFGHVGGLAVVREDGLLWVEDGTKENQLALGGAAMDDLINKEMHTMEGIVTKSFTVLNDHLEDSYFSSLLNVQLKQLRGEDTKYA